MPSANVIVVGGGLAGLAAAVALADSGFQVSILEKSPRLGGRATSYELSDGETIDNCQHVTLGCCTNLADFYRRIGASGKIKFHQTLVFAGPDGRRAQIRKSSLPAPLHLAPSFARFPFLNGTDKRRIAGALFRIARSGGRPRVSSSMTMLDWLKQQRQTPRGIERFWKTVLVSALNENLDRMDAGYGITVFWKAFLSNPEGFAIGIPAVPLSELYDFRHDRIDVRTRTGVAEVRPDVVRLENGSDLRAGYCVVAIPFDRLAKVLPVVSVSNLRVSPITSVHFWFDRVVMQEPFAAVLDRTIQWIFNRSNGQYVQIVISASYGLTGRSQQEIIELCRKELAEIIPATKEAALKRSVVIRENSATFSPEPGCDVWRPSQRTPIPNVFIAGDWTQTGWPATMESAVRSGYLAAEEILKLEGLEGRFLQPDLPAKGISAWFAGKMGS